MARARRNTITTTRTIEKGGHGLLLFAFGVAAGFFGATWLASHQAAAAGTSAGTSVAGLGRHRRKSGASGGCRPTIRACSMRRVMGR
jgi:hypothetical protein